MKRPRLAPVFLLFGSLLIAGEVFFSAWESARETEARRLNGIGESEPWFFAGSLLAPAVAQLAIQGPGGKASDFFLPDPELGYRPRPNLRSLPGRLRVGGNTVYEVSYSTNRFGWRLTREVWSSADHVLFFGNSFVFGIGLQDGHTLPDQFAKAMGRVLDAHNYGVPGWSTKQHLSLLAHGREKQEHVLERVTKAFYLLNREKGRIGGENSLSQFCSYSALCDWTRAYFRERSGGDGNSELEPGEVGAALARMAEIVKERYGCSLTVISWNKGDPLLDSVENKLRANSIDLVPLRIAIPDFVANYSAYVLPFDERPNARAMELLGSYLADRLKR